MVCKWRFGTGLWSSGVVSRDIGDRRQSVSRQPSFTLSEWTDAQEDLLDMDPVPQTPVFEMGTDTRTEGDAATLTVTPVGLQERLEWAAEGSRVAFFVCLHFYLDLHEGVHCIYAFQIHICRNCSRWVNTYCTSISHINIYHTGGALMFP